MRELYPKKGTNVWVVKVRWASHCPECKADVEADCKRRGLKNGPGSGPEFFVPFQWADVKCIHGLDSKIFQFAGWGRRENETGVSIGDRGVKKS